MDHYPFLQRALASCGYAGMFTAKPDSPCLYLEGNNGPDGCAIFYRESQFRLLGRAERVIPVWGVPSNQVGQQM